MEDDSYNKVADDLESNPNLDKLTQYSNKLIDAAKPHIETMNKKWYKHLLNKFLLIGMYTATYQLCKYTGEDALENAYTKVHYDFNLQACKLGAIVQVIDLLMHLTRDNAGVSFKNGALKVCHNAIMFSLRFLIVAVYSVVLYYLALLISVAWKMSKVNTWKDETEPFITNASSFNAFVCWVNWFVYMMVAYLFIFLGVIVLLLVLIGLVMQNPQCKEALAKMFRQWGYMFVNFLFGTRFVNPDQVFLLSLVDVDPNDPWFSYTLGMSRKKSRCVDYIEQNTFIASTQKDCVSCAISEKAFSPDDKVVLLKGKTNQFVLYDALTAQLLAEEDGNYDFKCPGEDGEQIDLFWYSPLF